MHITHTHAGFESGRVLVACTASGSFGCEDPEDQPPASSPSAPHTFPAGSTGPRKADTDFRGADLGSRGRGGSKGGFSHGREGLTGEQGVHRRRGHGDSSSSSSKGSGQAEKAKEPATWGSSGTDGYQLSLVLAAKACEAIMGVSAESGGLSTSSSVMDLQRPCLRACGVPETIGGDTLQV
eukprot:1159130-Pelagomonas_calceolata.AAC.21